METLANIVTVNKTSLEKYTKLWDWLNYQQIPPEQLSLVAMENAPNKPIFKVDRATIKGHHYIKLNYHQTNCPPDIKLFHQARGIIFEYHDRQKMYQVVCYPFDRFFNWNQEGVVASLDWATTTVQEKVDGSILMAWWCSATDDWQFSTRGKIEPLSPFADEIARLRNSILKTDHFKREHTYMFELYTHIIPVCITYPKDRVVHLGTRLMNAPDYSEINYKLPGYEQPRVYNFDDYQSVCQDKTPGIEGYVLVDANWNRQKVKTVIYLAMARQAQIWCKSDYDLCRMYLTGEFDNILRDQPMVILQQRYDKIQRSMESWLKYHGDIIANNCQSQPQDILRDKKFPSSLKKYIDRKQGLPESPGAIRQFLVDVLLKFNNKAYASILERFPRA